MRTDHRFLFFFFCNCFEPGLHLDGEPNASARRRDAAALSNTHSRENVNIMRTATITSISMRTLLSSVALALPLALALTACDGVDDLDARDGEEVDPEEVEPITELKDAVHPPVTGQAVAEPEFIEELAEDEAPAHAQSDSFPLSNGIHPTAACFFYTQKASLNLADSWGTVYGNVTLNTNCAAAYARTTITNGNVTAAQHLSEVRIEYWNSAQGVWTVWQAKSSSWVTNALTTIETTPTNFAIGTYVRACGHLAGGLLLGDTGYKCTPYFQISSST